MGQVIHIDPNASAGGGGGSYSSYIALLTQSAGGAPTAVVLENTLGGTLVWARGGAGVYTATLNGAFAANKTYIQVTTKAGEVGIPFGLGFDNNHFTMNTFTSAGVNGDDLLNSSAIEIRVYD